MKLTQAQADDFVHRVAELWKVEIELRGYNARDLAERAFFSCREMGHRVAARAIITAAASQFDVTPESVMKMQPHADTLRFMRRAQ